MRLVIYSGGQLRKNEILHDALSHLAGVKKQKLFTYIPFCHEGSDIYFQRAVKRYSRFGFTHFLCLHVDKKLCPETVKRAFEGDVIYLAGGNTFYFLEHLRRSGLLPKLKRFVAQGGVIAGLSAGAILLTPHIGLAGYPDFDRDENDVGLSNLRALNLVRFEFYPHFQGRKKVTEALRKYSLTSKYPVVASQDGGGIVVTDGKAEFVGQNHLFTHGFMQPLSSNSAH